MNGERLSSVAEVLVESIEGGLEITAEAYRLNFETSRHYATFRDDTGEVWTEFSAFSNIHTAEQSDATLDLDEPTYDIRGDGAVIVRQRIYSSAWDYKERVWICRRDLVETYEQVRTSEPRTLSECHMLGGDFTGQDRSGFFPSKTEFKSVFNPQPDIRERRSIPAYEPTLITTNGMWVAGRAQEFNVPTAWCFGLSKMPSGVNSSLPDGRFLMVGVATPIENQNFTEVKYDTRGDGWSINLFYENHTVVKHEWQTPSLLLHFSEDPYVGLADHADHGRRLGLIEEYAAPETAEWQEKPMFCGWGAQLEKCNTLKSLGDSALLARDLATEEHYDEFLYNLEKHGVWPHTIVIDDMWQKEYGTNTPDLEKWPDMRAWIDHRHKIGQRVLLWYRMWSPQGLAPELCVLDAAGRPVSSDPSNPEFLQLNRQQVNYMLSPDGLNADGLKVDFLAQTPTGPTLKNHGPQWGASMLHRYLKNIFDSAKDTKPDSLIITHCPSPSFADVSNMTRFNDNNDEQPIIPQMNHRYKVAKSALPYHLRDTDNWPMKDREMWRDYLRVQPSLGVVALYYDQLVAGEELEDEDYDNLRRVGFIKPTRNNQSQHQELLYSKY